MQLRRLSSLTGITATFPKQPIHIWDATEQSPGVDVITVAPGGHEQVERATLAIAGGHQLGIHAALGAPDQAATPPLFAAIPVSLRCAMR